MIAGTHHSSCKLTQLQLQAINFSLQATNGNLSQQVGSVLYSTCWVLVLRPLTEPTDGYITKLGESGEEEDIHRRTYDSRGGRNCSIKRNSRTDNSIKSEMFLSCCSRQQPHRCPHVDTGSISVAKREPSFHSNKTRIGTLLTFASPSRPSASELSQLSEGLCLVSYSPVVCYTREIELTTSWNV